MAETLFESYRFARTKIRTTSKIDCQAIGTSVIKKKNLFPVDLIEVKKIDIFRVLGIRKELKRIRSEMKGWEWKWSTESSV